MSANKQEFADLSPRLQKRAQITVTLPAPLEAYVRQLAKDHELGVSATVAAILEHDKSKREETLMREGYEEMARRRQI